MKALIYSLCLAGMGFFMLQSCTRHSSGQIAANRQQPFDNDWRFMKDNLPDGQAGLTGAEAPGFDDSQWRTLDLPHDWSIEDLPDQKEDSVVGPFSKASIGKMGTGFTVGGTAWYRKTFTIDKADKNKIAYLQFDGIYMNSDIWINGKHVGNHPHGYTSFWYDITPYLNPAGQPNTVAIQVKNEGRNARWYSGSGIYRHTWLTLVNPVHIGMWGVYVTTPVATEKSADIDIITTLANKDKENASVTLLTQIIDPSGKVVGIAKNDSSLLPGSSNDFTQRISIESPALWSTENPNLYQAQVTVLVNNKEADNLKTTFGVRSIHFDAQTGFTLNGKSIKLKGGCFHHDNGPLGSAAIDRAEERKIELLKNAGFNAIRCSHNPPSPYLLDVCDRMGMLVIDEIYDMWEKPKIASIDELTGMQGKTKVSADDYSRFFKEWWQKDVQAMVVRDRNHPSVIMWSIGNEIPEAADAAGLRIAKNLAGEVRRLDPTRAVTEAMVDFMAFTTGKSGWDNQAPHMDLLDVIGYNYGFERYKGDHQKYPDRIIYASEFMPPLSLQNWQSVEELPYVIGNFSWTAMDYLGEAGVGLPRLIEAPAGKPGAGSNPMAAIMQFFSPDSWPIFNNFQGDLDLIGNPKTPYYYQHVVWRDSKVEMLIHRPIPPGKIEIVSPWGFPDELKSWNWDGHEGEKMQVHVYTRSQLVKLELNGKVIGEQTVDENKTITATFEVPYEAGTLTARCFDNGVETASDMIKTVGKPAAIRLNSDRSTIKASRNDLSYVLVEITDAEGNIIPYADDILVNFEISGNGEIAGVGSGSPTDMSSFQQPHKKTWQGKCLAIIRPKGEAGKIVLKAKAEGLQEDKVEIITE
jgi:beta-galactosidase